MILSGYQVYQTNRQSTEQFSSHIFYQTVTCTEMISSYGYTGRRSLPADSPLWGFVCFWYTFLGSIQSCLVNIHRVCDHALSAHVDAWLVPLVAKFAVDLRNRGDGSQVVCKCIYDGYFVGRYLRCLGYVNHFIQFIEADITSDYSEEIFFFDVVPQQPLIFL